MQELAEQYLTPGTMMLGHLNHPTILLEFGEIQPIVSDRNHEPVILGEKFGTSWVTGWTPPIPVRIVACRPRTCRRRDQALDQTEGGVRIAMPGCGLRDGRPW
jgi:hypothetical protein